MDSFREADRILIRWLETTLEALVRLHVREAEGGLEAIRALLPTLRDGLPAALDDIDDQLALGLAQARFQTLLMAAFEAGVDES